MPRRAFLKLILGAGALWLLPSWFSGLIPAPFKRQLLQSRLAALFKNRESAQVIGREYLNHSPQEANPQVLLNLLSAGLAIEAELFFLARDDKLRQSLERRIRQDFEDEHVVRVRGWLLSATEARLCALAALVA